MSYEKVDYYFIVLLRELFFELATEIFGTTVQPLYNTPYYNSDLDITWSCCGSQIFLSWQFTKEL